KCPVGRKGVEVPGRQEGGRSARWAGRGVEVPCRQEGGSKCPVGRKGVVEVSIGRKGGRSVL
ncbi:unnamed protein product, partial [Staurois parvus]